MHAVRNNCQNTDRKMIFVTLQWTSSRVIATLKQDEVYMDRFYIAGKKTVHSLAYLIFFNNHILQLGFVSGFRELS